MSNMKSLPVKHRRKELGHRPAEFRIRPFGIEQGKFTVDAHGAHFLIKANTPC
jgi:hypothetical protein